MHSTTRNPSLPRKPHFIPKLLPLRPLLLLLPTVLLLISCAKSEQKVYIPGIGTQYYPKHFSNAQISALIKQEYHTDLDWIRQ